VKHFICSSCIIGAEENIFFKGVSQLRNYIGGDGRSQRLLDIFYMFCAVGYQEIIVTELKVQLQWCERFLDGAVNM
jgi:hypothetical protein